MKIIGEIGKISMVICVVIGIISIIYFIVVASHTHLNNKFPIIWLLLGVILIITGMFHYRVMYYYERIPLWIRWMLGSIVILAVILFVALSYQIISHFRVKEENKLSYIVVLGAQMKEAGPSLCLKYRIDRAVAYMKSNEKTIAVLSGGKGKNEPMSEAMGMYQYMIARDIDQSRMILEEQSVNTYENLALTRKLVPEIRDRNCKVGIVTSEFHMYRAKKIAQKQGYKEIYCLPSRTEAYMLPTAVTREIAAILKDFLVGNL